MKSNLNEFSSGTLPRQRISHTTSLQECRTAHAFERNSLRCKSLLRNQKIITCQNLQKIQHQPRTMYLFSIHHHYVNKFVANQWGHLHAQSLHTILLSVKEHDTQCSNLNKIMKGSPDSGAVSDLFHHREHHEGHPHPLLGWTKGETAPEQTLPADLLLQHSPALTSEPSAPGFCMF